MAIFTVSVKTGNGLDAWLDEVKMRSDAGKRIAEVDYDVYAEGEAVLGWLNATITLRGEQEVLKFCHTNNVRQHEPVQKRVKAAITR